ncbi:MAG: DUF58 domain-containing protein [Lachnospiraceae bacterium]|nr:DUF58 domain-containing protein [Lachnospiraceae bacterium]
MKKKNRQSLTENLIQLYHMAIYLMLLIGLFFLSTFYRTGIFVFFLILVISLPPASYMVGRFAFRNLTLSLSSSTGFTLPDTDCGLSIHLTNDSFFPLPDCHITYHITSAFYPCDKTWIANVPSYGRDTFSFTLPMVFHHVGCYQIRVTHLTVYDLLHFFRFDKDLDKKLEISVFPPEHEVEVFEPSSYGEGFDEFEETSQKGNTSSNVTDIREYIPGDRLQKIHWKLSAKIDKLMVKENESTSSNQFTILTELYLPNSESDTLDKSLENAYTLSRSLILAGVTHFFTFYCAASSEFVTASVTSKEDLDRIMPEIFYHTPYPQEDLALTVYEKAGVMGGVLLHVTHKGVADVAF